MDYFKKILQKSGWISIIESVIFAILGVILITNPDGTVKFISWILGLIFIGVGTSKCMAYASVKGKNDLYNNDIIYGIMAIVLGLVTIIYSSTIGSILRIIIGIWIIYSALIRIGLATKLKNMESKIWMFSLAIAILMFLFGLYIILNSGAIIATVGIIMIVSSLLDIVEDVILMNNIKEI